MNYKILGFSLYYFIIFQCSNNNINNEQNNYDLSYLTQEDKSIIDKCVDEDHKKILKSYLESKNIENIKEIKTNNDFHSSAQCKQYKISTNDGKEYSVFVKQNHKNSISTTYCSIISDILKDLGLLDQKLYYKDGYLLTEDVTKLGGKIHNGNFIKAAEILKGKISNVNTVRFVSALLNIADNEPYRRLDNFYIKGNKLGFIDFEADINDVNPEYKNYDEFIKIIYKNINSPFSYLLKAPYVDYLVDGITDYAKIEKQILIDSIGTLDSQHGIWQNSHLYNTILEYQEYFYSKNTIP